MGRCESTDCDAKNPSSEQDPPRRRVQPHDAGGIGPVPRRNAMAKVIPKVIRAIETKLIHAGEPDPRIGGAVAMPIFKSATFAYRGEQNYHDLRYIRLSNTPNHEVLHRKLAALENAEAALVAGSGMAAISTTILALLGAGDHLLAQ